MGSSISSKKRNKKVNMRYHSSEVEFVRSFFGGNRWPQKAFRNYLTFSQASIQRFFSFMKEFYIWGLLLRVGKSHNQISNFWTKKQACQKNCFFDLTHFRELGQKYKIFLFVFASNENFKFCFLDLLTFSKSFHGQKIKSFCAL